MSILPSEKAPAVKAWITLKFDVVVADHRGGGSPRVPARPAAGLLQSEPDVLLRIPLIPIEAPPFS